MSTKARLLGLQKALAAAKVDAIAIFDRANTLYFTGFACSNSATLVTTEHAIFLTDFRYMEAAARDIEGFEVRQMLQRSCSELAEFIKAFKVRRLGLEDNLPWSVQQELAGSLPLHMKYDSISSAISKIRMVKDEAEIATIAANQATTERVLRAAVRRVVAGQSEVDIAKSIRLDMLNRNVGEAFDTIVAAGPSSSLPHAIPGRRRLRSGDFLLFDLGVRANAYHSDMTRTYIAGKASALHREVYAVVLEAQERALAMIRHGVPCHEVDAAARQTIAKAGYGDRFGHGLGHGVGLEIHEGPTLNARSNDTLASGMVVTVEPGIYIPGVGGVRIEDLVVVTRTGYRNLNSMSKRLTIL